MLSLYSFDVLKLLTDYVENGEVENVRQLKSGDAGGARQTFEVRIAVPP
jgi:hypothetical protein